MIGGDGRERIGEFKECSRSNIFQKGGSSEKGTGLQKCPAGHVGWMQSLCPVISVGGERYLTSWNLSFLFCNLGLIPPF